MRILITGGNKSLGQALLQGIRQTYSSNTKVMAPDKDFMDITKEKSVQFMFEKFKPDVVFHFEEVDGSEPVLLEDLRRVNVAGTKNIVKACEKYGSRLVYLSSVFVFDGYKKKMYTINDIPEPSCTYGTTKLEAEEEVRKYKNSCVVRATSVYSEDNDNYIKDYITKAQNGEVIPAYDDAYISPTSEKDLVDWFITTLQSTKTGTFHVANKGCVSEYDFVCYVLEKYGFDPSVIVQRVSKKDLSEVFNMALDTQSLNYNLMPTLPVWEDSVSKYIIDLKTQIHKTKKD